MNRIKRIIVATLLLCILIAGAAGCTPETDVPRQRVSSTNEIKSKRTTVDRSALETTEDNWKPVQAAEQVIQQRNPFRGFTDTILAEALLREKTKAEETARDALLPEQMYGTKDYRIVGVITGTAIPKVYVIDPGGNRFMLQTNSYLGNKGGTIASIRRDGIVVTEFVDGKIQPVEIPIYEENKDKKKIQLSLQP